MKTNLAGTKTLKSLIAVVLTMVFLAAVPLHHHADGKVHDGDCQLCAVTNHALLPDVGSVAAVIFILLFAVILCETVIPSVRKDIPHLRGPPVF
ncbi:MAG: hypothetical protein NTX59_02930 [Elusimicrobia bacterium]|nr:hypothetical protein [Elusimicrobiota bacterium]